MKIYAGNLSYDVTEEKLRELFGAFGEVDTVTVIMDKFTNKSKGFGFIEMPVKEEAEAAIEKLNGQEVDGRSLKVNEAKPREDKPRGGGRGFGGGQSRGGFGGGPNRNGGSRGGSSFGNRGGGGGRSSGGGGGRRGA